MTSFQTKNVTVEIFLKLYNIGILFGQKLPKNVKKSLNLEEVDLDDAMQGELVLTKFCHVISSSQLCWKLFLFALMLCMEKCLSPYQMVSMPICFFMFFLSSCRIYNDMCTSFPIPCLHTLHYIQNRVCSCSIKLASICMYVVVFHPIWAST